MQKEINVVMVEPHKNPTITTLKNKLENLQEAVGGLIEFISGSIDEEAFKKYRNLCGRIQRMLTSSCITIEKKIDNK